MPGRAAPAKRRSRALTAVERRELDDQAAWRRRAGFQHYAYLVRAGELHMEYQRFDEDSRTALNGGHVWTALIEAGRATQRGGLAVCYMGALLGAFDRGLIPREIVHSFYNNPAFPLATSTDEIRRVLYQLITGDWELVDADDDPLVVAGSEHISISSIGPPAGLARR